MWRIVAASIACTLVPWTASGAAPAQQTTPIPTRLTLDLAIEIFLDRNPTIRAERQNIVIARADVTNAGQWSNPTFSYTADNVGVSTDPDASFWADQDMTLSIEQRIPIGGRRGKGIDVAEQGVAVAQSTLRDTIRRLTLELQRRYYGVVLGAQELQLAEDLLGQFDQVVQLTEQRYEQGEASGLELSRLRTEHLRFFSDRVAAQAALANSKVALLEILGSDSLGVDVQVEEILEYKPVEANPDELERQALQNRPDLAAQRSRIEQARRQQDFERSTRVPDLVSSFGYNRDFGRNGVAYAVSMDIPIFSRNQGRVARAVAETGRQLQALVIRQLGVGRDVRQAHTLVNAQAQIVVAMEAEYVPMAQAARDIAQASYTLGALDLIAFLDAERAYRETLRGYYQALYDHQVSRFTLDAVVGRDGSR